jgi:hypothetical protein
VPETIWLISRNGGSILGLCFVLAAFIFLTFA